MSSANGGIRKRAGAPLPFPAQHGLHVPPAPQPHEAPWVSVAALLDAGKVNEAIKLAEKITRADPTHVPHSYHSHVLQRLLPHLEARGRA